MPFGERRSRMQKKQIKEKILTYIQRGLLDKDIYRTLQIPKTTYFRYLKELNEELRKEFFAEADRIISGYVHRQSSRVREAMLRYSDAKQKGKSDDKKWFEIAAGIDKEFMEKLQQFGILEKAAERIKQEITGLDVRWMRDDESYADFKEDGDK